MQGPRVSVHPVTLTYEGSRVRIEVGKLAVHDAATAGGRQQNDEAREKTELLVILSRSRRRVADVRNKEYGSYRPQKCILGSVVQRDATAK